jgi:hypothetical protein
MKEKLTLFIFGLFGYFYFFFWLWDMFFYIFEHYHGDRIMRKITMSNSFSQGKKVTGAAVLFGRDWSSFSAVCFFFLQNYIIDQDNKKTLRNINHKVDCLYNHVYPYIK